MTASFKHDGYLNTFDEVAPPSELIGIKKLHGGVISRVFDGARHGWTYKLPGTLSGKSRALLRSIGFTYQSRDWTRWDVPIRGRS